MHRQRERRLRHEHTVQNNTPTTLNLSLPDGNYQLMVTCIDNASNAGSDQRSITFKRHPHHSSSTSPRTKRTTASENQSCSPSPPSKTRM